MNKKVFNEKFFSQHNIKDMNKINYATQKIILENNKMTTSKNKLINSYRKKNPKWKGRITKDFINFNKKQLKEGLTNLVLYDNTKIYDRVSKRVVNKNTYLTNNGNLRKKFQNDNYVKRGDTILNIPKYLKPLKKKIRDAEKTNKTTSIPIDFKLLDDNMEKLLEVLRPKIKQYVLRSNDRFYTLNTNSIKKMIDFIKEDFKLEYYQYDSAKMLLNSITELDDLVLEIREPQKNQKIDGKFFPYYHKLVLYNAMIDLKDYQIFTINDKDEEYKLNCLCYALSQAGIDISPIKHLVRSQDVPQSVLGKVADLLNIYITIKRVEANGHIRKYGNPDNKLVELGIIEHHYFLIKKTKYTRYSIENFKKICYENNFNTIIGVQEKNGKKYFKRAERFINSFDLIKLLCSDKEKYLKEITYNRKIYKYNYQDNIKDYGSLEYNRNIQDKENPTGNVRENNPKSKFTLFDKIYKFDFETTTEISREETKRRKENGEKQTEHKPFMVYTHEHKQGFWGEDCGRKLLDDILVKYGREQIKVEIVEKGKKRTEFRYKDKYGDIKEEPAIINLVAHNSTYDFRFIQQYLYQLETIEKGNNLVVANGVYIKDKKMIKIVITDSWKMISMPLKNFKKTFKLKTKKEIMPYELYNEVNVAKRFINLKECLTYLKIDERDEFIENCKLWNCLEDDDVDILKYAGEYCYMDCVVLHQGYEKFRELVRKALNVDITNYLTIASLADDYLKIQGCYDDVYMLSGVPRAFIQECVVGGRTMMRANTPSRMLNTAIDDFDAVSLYPSAMARMEGFLQGIPNIIEDGDKFEEMKDMWDGYFIQIKITELNKKRLFPLQSILNDGIRNFTNDIVGRNIFIDKTGLEDLIKFQDVKYEFIKGYYYNDGFNTEVNKTIKFLFNERIKMKKIGSPLQMVYKLAMNSSYGKSLLKPIDEEIDYVKTDSVDKFIDRHFNYIKEGTILANKSYWKVKRIKVIDNHFNNVHIGASILSMSKRIMNEVMCLGEDLNLNMYYQDTDSIHIDNHSVPILAEEFKKKYNKDLIGKGMGQFHTDFDMDNACGEIIAKNSIFLGKKCYIDELESKDKDGNIITDYHIRMKGIPSECILHKAKQLSITPLDLYNYLYDDYLFNDYSSKKIKEDTRGIEFNLLAVKPKFEMGKNMTIISKLEFNRRVKFDCSNGIDNTTFQNKDKTLILRNGIECPIYC